MNVVCPKMCNVVSYMQVGGTEKASLACIPTLSPVIQRMYNSLVWNDQDMSINGF